MKTVRLVIAAFRDLLIQKGFIRPKKPERAFAFIIHPRDISDVARKYPFAKHLPAKLVEILIRYLWPIVGSRVTGLKDDHGNEIPGWIVICPLSARQLLENRKLGKKRILQTVRLAERLGAKIVGLGALTSSVTNGGLDIADQTSALLVTGRTMTAIAVSEYLSRILSILGESLEQQKIAIIGAGGSVGAASALLFVRKGARHLTLIDLEKKSERVERLIKNLLGDRGDLIAKKSHHIGDIKDADIIITATNAPEALVTSDDVTPGSIVIDDAQPSDIHPEVMQRDDILVVFGGIVKTPHIYSHFNFSIAGKDENFSCLAETMLLVKAGIAHNFALGHITVNQLELIEELAKKEHFESASFQNSRRTYTKEDIERMRVIRSNRRPH